MTPLKTFREISIVAAIMAVTKRIPNMLISDGSDLAEFEFKDDQEVQDIVMQLATGRLTVNAVEYEKARNYLYRKVRDVKRQGVSHV